MSTDHMPNPPDQPSSQVNSASVKDQAGTPPAEVAAEPSAPFDLNADVARILEEQADVIVQRQVYHTQMLFGVSGLGTDPVNARNATLSIARALRNNTPGVIITSLANLGDTQMGQINDHTTPFNFNAQVAGLLEGILVDTISQAYKEDPARRGEARVMLEQLFIDANEHIEANPQSSLVFRLPGASQDVPKQLR